MDITQAPKQYCDNINVAFTEDVFLMAVASGQAAIVYALTPQHAKKLAQMLSHNVSKYENEFGEIKAEWSENVPSPIQFKKADHV